MYRTFNKLTVIFATQILFTVLQVRQRVTVAESELYFNNQTLQQLFSSPHIFKGNLTQVFEDAHFVGYNDEWVEPVVHLDFHDEIAHPKMTVYFKQAHFSNLTGIYNASLTKQAPVYLYQPKKSPGYPSVYRYDQHNPLYIVETEQNACYEVVCTSPHLIKWVTNIPVKDVASEFEPLCGSWKYMNSRRLNDKYDSPAGRSEANESSLYTIEFLFMAYESNMGLLTCQNIANSSSATHFYFTDYPVFEKTTDLVNFVNKPKTGSMTTRHITNKVIDAFNSPMELFWENSTSSSFVVPCRGSRLSVKPHLSLTLLYLSVNGELNYKVTQLWGSVQGSLVSQLQYDSDLLSALYYDPVRGFTLDPAFQYFLFGYVPADSLVRIHFNCTAEDGSKMQFNVYPFKKAQPGSVNHGKITELVQENELLERRSGCFYIRASDQFVSKAEGSLTLNFN